jgi:hypothetical protein
MFFRQPSSHEQPLRQPRSRYPYGRYRDPDGLAGNQARTSSRARGYSRWDEDRETTRYLSAQTQLSIRYADYVVSQVVNERFRALAPAYGVDVAVVAKWALSSLKLRLRRDLMLSLILAAGIVLLGASVLMVSAWPLAVIAVAAATMAAAWVIVLAEYLDRITCLSNHMLRSRFDPADAPEPADPGQRDRLRTVSRRRAGNLVVFRGRSAFVGSGFRLPKAGGHLVIDVSKGKLRKDAAGAEDQDDGATGEVTPEPFTNEDIHAAIMDAMDDLGLRDVNVDEWLFVNGKHVHGISDYLPTRKEPPTASVNPGLLRRAALHPTPDARVYVCTEMRGWQGQLVVTLFARAVHLGGTLYIEWSFYVLPPVSPSYQYVDHYFEDQRRRRFGKAGRRCLRKTPVALFGAPLRLFRSCRRQLTATRGIARQEYAIEKGRVFDYGAGRSIREHACGWERQHYFLERDEIMFVRLAQEKLMRAVSKFLGDKNVDLGQLESQIKIINENAISFYDVRLSDISNSNIAIGKQAQAKGSGSNSSGSSKDD